MGGDLMDYDKLVERLIACAEKCDRLENGMGDDIADAATAIEALRAENDRLREELDWKDKVVELAQRTEQKAAAEINLLSACVYYKRGGLCRYGGDDPANMCVLGPCPNDKSAEDILADLARVTAERDAAISDLVYIANRYPVELCDDLVCQYCKH